LMSVCCECCMLSGRGLCAELNTRPEESYRPWCVAVCDIETSSMRRQTSINYDWSTRSPRWSRGELSYLAPLGSENISAPYFKQCFFQGGDYPPDWVKHHVSQSQSRNNKYFILYIEFSINNKI